MHAKADAKHREALASASEQREVQTSQQTGQLVELLAQNTKLTELTRDLSLRIEILTTEMHSRFLSQSGSRTHGDASP